jgi:hypothetical protein
MISLGKNWIILLLACAIFISGYYFLFLYPRYLSLGEIYSNLERFNNSKVSIKGVVFTKTVQFPGLGNILYLENSGFVIVVRNLSKLYNIGDKSVLQE